MKALRYNLLTLLALVFIASCKEVIEPNISQKTINVITPKNYDTLLNPTVTFWWDELEGATKYKLQIVRPSFNNIQTLVADTNVSGTQFVKALGAGPHQWRIMAYNNSSSTAYFTRNLFIDSTLDLSNSTVVPLSPAQHAMVYAKNVTFTWQGPLAATSYQLQVMDTATGAIDVNIGIATSTYTKTLTNFSKYKWRVMGESTASGTQTPFSAWKTFTLVMKEPTLQSPVHKDSLSAPYVFNWSNRSAYATADSIFISSDSLFQTTPVKQDKIVSSATAASYTVSATGVFTAGHYYFWRIRSYDAAGGKSAWSNTWKVKIK